MKTFLFFLLVLPLGIRAQDNQIDSLVIQAHKFETVYVLPPTMESFRNTENLVIIHTVFHSEHLNDKQWVRLESREGELKFDGRVLIDCYAKGALQFSLFFKPNGTYITSFDDYVYSKNTGFMIELHQIFFSLCSFQ